MNGAGMNSAGMNSEQNALHPVERRRTVRVYDGPTEISSQDTSLPQHDLRHSNFITERSIPCTAARCSSRGICVLELQPFCLHHFITCCFERLRLCSISWCLYPNSATTAAYDAFIRECIVKTANLLQEGTDVDAVRRSHLLDVFLWASELAVKRNVSAPAEVPAAHQSSAHQDSLAEFDARSEKSYE
jgi:hypothetical protein